MPTKNPRLNVVLDESLYEFLSNLSKKEDKSMSVVAKELIQEAIDKHEDLALSELAMKRERESKRIIKHAKAWK
jgi:predicted DNA-binding protein